MAEYIEREAAIKTINILRIGLRAQCAYEFDLVAAEAKRRIDAIPAADVVEVRHGRRKKWTNADKYFRNVTDEELAERLSKQNFWNCPPHGKACPGHCYKCWLDWLKQEVKDE